MSRYLRQMTAWDGPISSGGAAEKKAVNDSQVKIGAVELPAVTQLFTEPYMVRFLLHNTLGAWWPARH